MTFNIIDQIGERLNAESIMRTVVTKGEELRKEMTMARQFAAMKNPVSYKMSERRGDGTNVGYVNVSESNSLVKSKLEEALTSLEGQGANTYILDMRSNPGGAFQSAVEIVGLLWTIR